MPWSEFAIGTRSLCKERWWRRLHSSQVVPSGFLQEFVRWARWHFRQRLFCFEISHFLSTVDFWYIRRAESKCFVLQPSGHFLSWSSPLSLACLRVKVLLCLANQSNLKHLLLFPCVAFRGQIQCYRSHPFR